MARQIEINRQYYSNKKERVKNGICRIANYGLPFYISKNGRKSTYCVSHRDFSAQKKKKKYEEKKQKGLCQYSNCERPSHVNENENKNAYCTIHKDKRAQKNKENRERWGAASCCLICGSPAIASLSGSLSVDHSKYKTYCERHLKSRCSLEARFKQGKRDAQQRMLEWITFDEYIALDPTQCHYCVGIIETTGHGLDRKNSSIRSYHNNCVPCCWVCNRIKGPNILYKEMLILIEYGLGAMYGFREREKEVQDTIVNKIVTQRKKEKPKATKKRIRKI